MIDRCPLCLKAQAFADNDEFSPGGGEGVGALSSLFSVHRVACPACNTYTIDEGALFLLKHCEEVRQRAVADFQQQGFLGHVTKKEALPTITVQLLDNYLRKDDILRA